MATRVTGLLRPALLRSSFINSSSLRAVPHAHASLITPAFPASLAAIKTHLCKPAVINTHTRSYGTPSVANVEDVQTLVEREHFAKVRKVLEGDARKKITYNEFVSICNKEGLSNDQAKQLAQSLSDAGVILHFANSSNAALRDFVYLKPVEFNNTVSRILREMSDDTYLREELAQKQSDLAKLKAELQPIEDKKAELEAKAARRATIILWSGYAYCLIQGAIVARLTWWELSWDVMEPVTYMLTFATVMIGYSYFLMTRNEYTYEGLRKTLERRGLAKLFRRKQFDEKAYKALQDAVVLRESEVKRILVDIKNDPVTLHLKDPSQPVV